MGTAVGYHAAILPKNQNVFKTSKPVEIEYM